MLEINAAVKAQVAYQADSDAIPVARVNGITTAAVIPSGGLLGGQIAVMNLDGWTWEEATLRPVAGVSFQFPTIGRTGGGGGGGRRQPRRESQVRGSEEGARRAGSARRGSARARSRLLQDSRPNDRRTDWTLAALVPIVEGRQPLFVFANGEREIRDAVAFADRAGVKIVITGGLESPLVAPLLKEKNVPVILGSVLTLPAREDAHHAATYRAAGELAQAGVTFAFGTGGAANNRLLPYEAAISVAWGLDRDRALRAITLDAATILGVGDRVGSLEAGKIANLFVSTGDPMEMKTPVHAHLHQRHGAWACEQAHDACTSASHRGPEVRSMTALPDELAESTVGTGSRTMHECRRQNSRRLRMRALRVLRGFSLRTAASAQQEAPYTYAITGARIVPVSSAPIDNATIVFSDGVITQVGSRRDATRRRASDRRHGAVTVYPGLIDMGSAAGLEAPPVPRADNPQTTEDVERVKRDTLLRADLRAADHMNPKSAALSRAAAAGITATLATPAGDGIRGQSALVFTALGADAPQIGALADERRGALVIKTPVALHVGTADRPAGGDAYPNSLMGIIAFNRQAFSDAAWYAGSAGSAGSSGSAGSTVRKRCPYSAALDGHAAGARRPDARRVPRHHGARRFCARSIWRRRSSSIRSSLRLAKSKR